MTHGEVYVKKNPAIIYMRLKTFAVVVLYKSFWLFTRCHCLVMNQRFGTSCVSHHQGREVIQAIIRKSRNVGSWTNNDAGQDPKNTKRYHFPKALKLLPNIFIPHPIQGRSTCGEARWHNLTDAREVTGGNDPKSTVFNKHTNKPAAV